VLGQHASPPGHLATATALPWAPTVVIDANAMQLTVSAVIQREASPRDA
jgi:hypothetical protein